MEVDYSRAKVFPRTHSDEGIPVVWYCPAAGWIKINTDGAYRGKTGKASCGGVFRDCAGRISGAFSELLDHKSAIEAEIRGVIRAIELAWTAGVRRYVWLECDSMQVVKLANNRSSDVPLSVKNDWIAALEKMDIIGVRVTHIYREGNQVADKLANYAIDHTAYRLYLWEGTPYFVVEEAKKDAFGFVHCRTKGCPFANQVADKLANLAIGIPKETPCFVGNEAKLDAFGYIHPRVELCPFGNEVTYKLANFGIGPRYPVCVPKGNPYLVGHEAKLDAFGHIYPGVVRVCPFVV